MATKLSKTIFKWVNGSASGLGTTIAVPAAYYTFTNSAAINEPIAIAMTLGATTFSLTTITETRSAVIGGTAGALLGLGVIVADSHDMKFVDTETPSMRTYESAQAPKPKAFHL